MFAYLYYKSKRIYAKILKYRCIACNKSFESKTPKNICPSCKRKQTNLERYGVENISQLKEVKEKIKKSNITKYGFESHNSSDKVKDKKRKKFLEKYGEENPWSFGKQKYKQALLNKYGVDNPLKDAQIKERVENTNLDKYGVKSLLKKSGEYMLEKYGEKHSSYLEKTIKKRKETFYRKFFDFIKTSRMDGKVKPLFEVEELFESNKYDKLKWVCCVCGEEFYDNYANGKIPRCPKCFPTKQSNNEKELSKWLSDIASPIIERSKDIIPPYEIDIYLPKHLLAVEYNGVYWHSEQIGTPKNYHQNKVKMCNDKGIRLIHVWEDEWLQNQDEVKEKILYYIDNLDEKIKPREPILEERMGFRIWT